MEEGKTVHLYIKENVHEMQEKKMDLLIKEGYSVWEIKINIKQKHQN